MQNQIIKERTERTKWYLHDRFGMFIHWGLYAIPARGEWIRNQERIPEAEYMKYFNEFNPVRYDPRQWARLAKEAGMKYVVLTSKHHDGFCLFDSALTDYKSTNTPYGKDIVREYLDAFRAEGIKVGLYYSIIDWHHPDYPHCSDQNHPMRGNPDYPDEGRNFDNYIKYFHGQVKELLTNYGHIDIMWFDFSYGEMSGEKWKATELIKMVRSIQPWIVVDNRLEASGSSYGSIVSEDPCIYSGDFASPEQMIPQRGITDVNGKSIPWESCITLNDHWGYCAADRHYKTPKMIIRALVECVSKNGNMILNVGPDAMGEIPEESAEILREVGRWMRRNSDSVYGCGEAEFAKPEWGRYTQNRNRVYAHILEEDMNATILDIPQERIDKIRLLRDRSEIIPIKPWNVVSMAGQTVFRIGAGNFPLPDESDTVVEITLKND